MNNYKTSDMKACMFLPVILLLSLTGCAQSNARGTFGMPCEGCEAVFECPVSLNQLNWVDTLPDFNDKGPKMLITGTIFEADGKTPAANVVLYVYHTDQTGVYPTKGNEKGWAKRHGYIRGWIRTNEEGRYAFYTLKPASYPTGKTPAHIHPVIKEADMQPYWIDEYLFDDDPYLTAEERKQQPKYGGSGILTLTSKDGVLTATRDIVLGLNIRNYPIKKGL
jgi:protocatechuate 3,4-dioxygenase beta subunit